MAGSTGKRKTAAEKVTESGVVVQVGEAPKTPVETDSGAEVGVVVEATVEPEGAAEVVEVAKLEGDVVAEYTQQLSIFNQLIYNARNDDVTLVVENLGYGDIYVSDKAGVRVGSKDQRLLFKEQRAFKSGKLYLTSASQPVASIIEIK